MQLRKWYAGINAHGMNSAESLVRVAITSARRHSALRPVWIYDGDDPRHVDLLEGLGAEVVRHRSSLTDSLARYYGPRLPIYSGHWLRIDIPRVETEDAHVLYTDIDVMFRGAIPPMRPPRYLAAAPETYRWRPFHFNSGVMVMNLPALRGVEAAFTDGIRRELASGRSRTGNDQPSYNRFFRFRRDRMEARMNWKPYWGLNPDARIVHFHGPKPGNVTDLQAGRGAEMVPDYARLWSKARPAYDRYVADFEAFLEESYNAVP